MLFKKCATAVELRSGRGPEIFGAIKGMIATFCKELIPAKRIC